MITDKYSDLIAHIASCNGTGELELQRKVDQGVLSADDSIMVYMYATLRKINQRLDCIALKTDKLQLRSS